ncbi:MAG: hypothetical protein AABW87_00360 [Nanoarchaeota archaeon]
MKIEILSESELARVFGSEERFCTACGEIIEVKTKERECLCHSCERGVLVRG